MFWVVACAAGAFAIADDAPIRIGVIGPVTGISSEDMGQSVIGGARVFAADITELHERATRMTAWDFLNSLIAAVPYVIHTALTDNGIQLPSAKAPKRMGPFPWTGPARRMALRTALPKSAIHGPTAKSNAGTAPSRKLPSSAITTSRTTS